MSSIFKSNFSIESCEDISEQETMFKLVKHVFEKALPLLIGNQFFENFIKSFHFQRFNYSLKSTNHKNEGF